VVAVAHRRLGPSSSATTLTVDRDAAIANELNRLIEGA
jgi:hypothetical protein